MTDLGSLLALLRDVQRSIRDAVVEACERQSVAELGLVAEDGPGDTIYQIDKVSDRELLPELVRELGPERGLYGAKITGGGSGGTVVVLGRADAGPAVQAVLQRYARETERVPQLFAGSSPGAAAFGVRQLRHGASGWQLEPAEGAGR